MRPDEKPTAQTKIRLADYAPPAWLVETVDLTFALHPTATRVRAKIAFRRNPAATGDRDLRLDGRMLKRLSAAIDGAPVAEGAILSDQEGLTIPGDLLQNDAFTWDCETEIDPEANTALEGLYVSNGMYCTQCEAQGFRKITYYPDRPDVMAVFTVRIEADEAACPVLLSNGEPGATGDLADGRHFAEWRDPWPKPAYLFALVAGNLVSHDDSFTTASGRAVDLKIFVRPGDEGKCAYAMDSLKRSMKWDEGAYGREYDLSLFMIVAVDDFNMGAMENKGLNIFNSKYVLASPETATDRDYELIEGIIAHEYFHNWTGNRITCRDWFQLCLKEGLTVFRDQQFSGDQRSHAVKRIDSVKALRARQFREDAGPLAHPVRPDAYVEINNFYTATVYEKGAEVINMLHRLVGPEEYRKALDLYFARHDGQACTIEDWLKVFEDSTGRDLSQFARWYNQAGTPHVKVTEDWAPDGNGGTYTLTFRQTTPATPGQPDKAPMVIPVAYGFLGANGDEIAEPGVLEITEPEESFSFTLPQKPVPSLLREFSAPVILERETTDAERAFLLANDPDPFNKWEAGRAYALDVLVAAALDGDPPSPAFIDALAAAIRDEGQDPAFRALVLTLPGEDEIAREVHDRGHPADPDLIHDGASAVKITIARRLEGDLTRLYEAMETPGPYAPDAASAGRRSLKSAALALLAHLPQGARLADAQYRGADNMSDRLPALAALVHNGAVEAEAALADFHDRWEGDTLVMDKWLALQATSPQWDTLGSAPSSAPSPWPTRCGSTRATAPATSSSPTGC
jgi:aminopeptidase N